MSSEKKKRPMLERLLDSDDDMSDIIEENIRHREEMARLKACASNNKDKDQDKDVEEKDKDVEALEKEFPESSFHPQSVFARDGSKRFVGWPFLRMPLLENGDPHHSVD